MYYALLYSCSKYSLPMHYLYSCSKHFTPYALFILLFKTLNSLLSYEKSGSSYRPLKNLESRVFSNGVITENKSKPTINLNVRHNHQSDHVAKIEWRILVNFIS